MISPLWIILNEQIWQKLSEFGFNEYSNAWLSSDLMNVYNEGNDQKCILRREKWNAFKKNSFKTALKAHFLRFFMHINFSMEKIVNVKIVALGKWALNQECIANLNLWLCRTIKNALMIFKTIKKEPKIVCNTNKLDDNALAYAFRLNWLESFLPSLISAKFNVYISFIQLTDRQIQKKERLLSILI